MDDKERGLYPKYLVQKIVYRSRGWAKDGLEVEPVEDWVFVLNPKKDPGAQFALRAYAVWAERNGYEQLGKDIREKLEELSGPANNRDAD